MSNDEEPEDSPGTEILPASTPQEAALDTFAALVAALPYLGGPISSTLSGLAADRRFERVKEVVLDLESRLDDLSTEQDDYIRSEDFEDLLRETLRRVENERTEAKRHLYRDFLLGTIREPGGDYDERLRILRALEQLQPDHMAVIRAMDQPPEPEHESVLAGSRMSTLRRRLPEMSNEHLDDLVTELGDLRITSGSLGGMVTGPSAVNLRPLITPFGHRLLEFIREPDDETDA